eukprot:403348301
MRNQTLNQVLGNDLNQTVYFDNANILRNGENVQVNYQTKNQKENFKLGQYYIKNSPNNKTVSKFFIKHNPDMQQVTEAKKRHMSLYMFENYDSIVDNSINQNATKYFNSKLQQNSQIQSQHSTVYNLNLETEISVPKNRYVTSKDNFRKIEYLKDRMKMNLFDHKNFNPIISDKNASKYYESMFKLNQTMLLHDQKDDLQINHNDNELKLFQNRYDNQAFISCENNSQNVSNTNDSFLSRNQGQKRHKSLIQQTQNKHMNKKSNSQNLTKNLFWQFKQNLQIPQKDTLPLDMRQKIYELSNKQQARFETLNKTGQLKKQIRDIENMLENGYTMQVNQVELEKQKERDLLYKLEEQALKQQPQLKKKLTIIKAEQKSKRMRDIREQQDKLQEILNLTLTGEVDQNSSVQRPSTVLNQSVFSQIRRPIKTSHQQRNKSNNFAMRYQSFMEVSQTQNNNLENYSQSIHEENQVQPRQKSIKNQRQRYSVGFQSTQMNSQFDNSQQSNIHQNLIQSIVHNDNSSAVNSRSWNRRHNIGKNNTMDSSQLSQSLTQIRGSRNQTAAQTLNLNTAPSQFNRRPQTQSSVKYTANNNSIMSLLDTCSVQSTYYQKNFGNKLGFSKHRQSQTLDDIQVKDIIDNCKRLSLESIEYEKAIEHFQGLAIEKPQDRVDLKQVIEINRLDNKSNLETFLNKQNLNEMRDDIKVNQTMVCQILRNRKLWKPDQLKISRQLRKKFQFLLRSENQTVQ